MIKNSSSIAREKIQETRGSTPTYFIRRPPPFFTGRGDEVETIVSLITQGERVVNVIGVGGQGKTALMLKCASVMATHRAIQELFPHGFVHLDFYEFPEIGRALNPFIRRFADPKGDKLELLERILKDRTFLFLLDGTENISNTDALEELLDKIGNSSVIVTSRRLDHAIRGPTIQLKSMGLEESVCLFKSIAGHDQGTKSVQEMCKLLGGHPLSVRLAANYMKKMPINKIHVQALKEAPFMRGGMLNRGQHSEESIEIMLMKSLRRLPEEGKN